jgi:hypothetical protein
VLTPPLFFPPLPWPSEIGCAKSGDKRCGLGGWGTHSQVAHAVATNPAGPYTRKQLILPPEHHNPTLKVSPVDGSWNIYSIDATSGPIVTSRSTDEGATWSSGTPGVVVSTEQNPGPFLFKNGYVGGICLRHCARVWQGRHEDGLVRCCGRWFLTCCCVCAPIQDHDNVVPGRC